jgi:hypothetical protein
VALAPVQPPEAAQLVASLELQVNVAEPPDTTEPTDDTRLTVGSGGDVVTVTVTARFALPPGPEQSRLKLVLALSAPVDSLPLVAFAPAQPPEAAQLVASVELQVNVAEPPTRTVPGATVRVIVGGGAAVTVTVTVRVALPPGPEQSSVKLELAPSAPVASLPLVAFAPVQPPEAVQLVASVELQVNVDEPPVATVPGAAVSVAVGAGLPPPPAEPPPEPPQPHDRKAVSRIVVSVRTVTPLSMKISAFRHRRANHLAGESGVLTGETSGEKRLCRLVEHDGAVIVG